MHISLVRWRRKLFVMILDYLVPPPEAVYAILGLHDLAFRYDNWYWSAHDVALALIYDEIELLDHEIYLLEQERQKLSLMIALEPDVQSEQYVCDE